MRNRISQCNMLPVTSQSVIVTWNCRLEKITFSLRFALSTMSYLYRFFIKSEI